ncbi:MAG TPA: response regulator [Pseudolabrys sp.]|jgi:CheY-like chemotaxis protein|nr:response regulator [Pseudolabrys sp.]
MAINRGQRATSVLLVEDEALISEFIAEELTAHGFEVHEASNAAKALDVLNDGTHIDILFTDIDLPGGMDGSELAERARGMRPELPIVYASGRYSPSAVAPLVPRSVFLRKPYDPDDLCRLIDRLTLHMH